MAGKVAEITHKPTGTTSGYNSDNDEFYVFKCDSEGVQQIAGVLDGTIDIEVGHGKTLVSPPPTGSHNTTTTKSLVAAAGAGIKNKVVGIVFSTLVDTACVVQLTDGSAGTVIYEIELQSSIVPGVSISPSVVEICETSANTALHLKLSVAQKVTYTLVVDQSA